MMVVLVVLVYEMVVDKKRTAVRGAGVLVVKRVLLFETSLRNFK
jgi:hypothetical protein